MKPDLFIKSHKLQKKKTKKEILKVCKRHEYVNQKVLQILENKVSVMEIVICKKNVRNKALF